MLGIGKRRIGLFTLYCCVVTFILFCSNDNVTNPDTSLPKKAMVKVTVSDDSTSNPIEGASVVIFNALTDSSADGITDSLGACFLEVNADTSYLLNVSASGYRPYPSSGATPDTFQVKENDTTERSIALSRIDTPAVVMALITDSSDNTPIENASVVIYKSGTTQPFANGLSDSLGACLLEVEGGLSYYLGVSAAGYLPYPLAGATADTFQVVEKDTTVRSVKLIKLDTSAVVKAVITDLITSNPVENATVVIYEASTNQELASGLSDNLGFCFFKVGSMFNYYLKVSAGGYLPNPLPGEYPAVFQVTADDTTVRAMKLKEISEPAEVKVLVSDDSTLNPVENAKVTIYIESNSQAVGSDSTDNLGGCLFTVDGDDYYYLKVSADGYFPYPLAVVRPDTFFVSANDTTVRNVVLKRKSSQAMVIVTVVEDSTNIPIKNADVIIFNSNTNQGSMRDLTDVDGKSVLFVAPYLPYYLNVAAQGYRSSPPFNGSPIPFQVGDTGSITYRNIELKKDSMAINSGTITGNIKTPANDIVAGCLAIAVRQGDSITSSGFSGPDGVYILYNVPEGTYDMEAHLEGWYQTTPVPGIQVTAGNITPNVDIEIAAIRGASLQGRITFLASQNSVCDITLTHPVSHGAIPGLNTFMLGNQTYFLDSIPPGTYIPWASYQNDGYVMDPDRIQKFGLPITTFLPGDSTKTLNFDVTDAVPIISPTNHPDTLIPFIIFTATPTFKWEIYPSAHEYIVGVYNIYGELIWGGYDTSANVLHPFLDSKTDSVVFNFDSSATEDLRWGRAYRWKVWADKGADPGVQQLISSSEEWLGLFMLGEKKK